MPMKMFSFCFGSRKDSLLQHIPWSYRFWFLPSKPAKVWWCEGGQFEGEWKFTSIEPEDRPRWRYPRCLSMLLIFYNFYGVYFVRQHMNTNFYLTEGPFSYLRLLHYPEFRNAWEVWLIRHMEILEKWNY